ARNIWKSMSFSGNDYQKNAKARPVCRTLLFTDAKSGRIIGVGLRLEESTGCPRANVKSLKSLRIPEESLALAAESMTIPAKCKGRRTRRFETGRLKTGRSCRVLRGHPGCKRQVCNFPVHNFPVRDFRAFRVFRGLMRKSCAAANVKSLESLRIPEES